MKMRKEKRVKMNIRHPVEGAPTKVKGPREQSKELSRTQLQCPTAFALYM